MQKTLILTVPENIGKMPDGEPIFIEAIIVKAEGELRIRKWNFIPDITALPGVEQERVQRLTPQWLFNCPNARREIAKSWGICAPDGDHQNFLDMRRSAAKQRVEYIAQLFAAELNSMPDNETRKDAFLALNNCQHLALRGAESLH